MSNPINTITPSLWKNPFNTGFIAATGTTAKVLLEPLGGAEAAGSSPQLYGGCAVLDLWVTSTDAAAKSLLLYVGTPQTTQDSTNTGSVTLTAQNTLTRATTTPQSFLTDGWRVGDQVMIFAPYGVEQVAAGIDGIVGTLTTVTAAALTVNGTPWAAGTNVLVSGSRLVNVSLLDRVAVPGNSGNTDDLPPVVVFSNTLSTANTPQEFKLDGTSLLIGAMAAAVAALPAVVSVNSRLARY